MLGYEVGKNNTPHIQGYVMFKNQVRFDSIKSQLPKAHIEACKGSADDNIKYCTKGGKFEEFGDRPRQGKRNDIDIVRDICKEAQPMRKICEVATSLQSIKIAEKLLTYNERKRNWKPEVLWFYGKSGTGKTRKAFDILEDPWVSDRSLKWWSGYDAHENVIIDDFRADFCTFHELLRILDRYPYTIEFKGGHRQLLAKRIIITSCYHPANVYSTREDIDQLLRRIDNIQEFKIDSQV